MRISIIIPAFDEERLLPETLRQVRLAAVAFERRHWVVEVIVCDNNSTDRTADLARAAGARVVFEPFNQIARARNSGARAATGDWLVFVDADSHPSEALFDDVAEQIASGKVLAGGATVQLEAGYPKARIVNQLWNCISRLCCWHAGSFSFCEGAVFRELGGFDEKLFASEEIEFSGRLKKRARSTGRKMVILHRHPILTSARKMRLYSLREHLRFLARLVFSRGAVLGDRHACHTWYDGRR